MKKTDDQTLIAALRILARDIASGDGVANAAIAEAADRLDELTQPNVVVLPPLPAGFAKVRSSCIADGEYFLWHIHAKRWSRWIGADSDGEYIRAAKEGET